MFKMFKTKFFDNSNDNKYLVISKRTFLQCLIYDVYLNNKFFNSESELKKYIKELSEKNVEFIIFEKSLYNFNGE